jgi:hypothetical protein
MRDPSNHGSREAPTDNFWTSRAFLVFLGFAAIALVLLWGEHRAHILGALPYLFILACPLMHIFMHRGHGRHHDHGGDDRTNRHHDGGRP